MAIIKAIGWVKEKLGINDAIHKRIDRPQKLVDIIPEFEDLASERVIILVNGKPATKDTVVTNNDEILVMPVTSGG